MPELPEVEVTRRGLIPFMEHQTIKTAWMTDLSLRWPLGHNIALLLCGKKVGEIKRRGKYLLIEILSKNKKIEGWLIWHLGMSGVFKTFLSGRAPLRVKHDHVELGTAKGVIRYHDPRRFGSLQWHPLEDGDIYQHPLLMSLGKEPWDDTLTAAYLKQQAKDRQVSIKQFLLAGHAVVGVGNIYASESLFMAKINPTSAANKVSLQKMQSLLAAIQHILEQAITVGGTSLKDFAAVDGNPGHFQLQTAVYGRAGEPCHICSTVIQKIVQQQRATYFCPQCQK